MNRYRVDVSSDGKVPVGMNSLHYLGDNLQRAKRAYEQAQPGVDSWGKADPKCGVILSEWSDARQQYIICLRKGFTS